MNKRPTIRVGDVVRFSKRYAKYGYRPQGISTMTVVSVIGDGADGRTAVRVAYNAVGTIVKATYKRRELWVTGYNIADAGKSFSVFKNRTSVPGGFSMGSHVQQPAAAKPVEKKGPEIKCSCGKMADKFKVCWWCGAQN